MSTSTEIDRVIKGFYCTVLPGAPLWKAMGLPKISRVTCHVSRHSPVQSLICFPCLSFSCCILYHSIIDPALRKSPLLSCDIAAKTNGENMSGAHFTKAFLITIQIQWKSLFALTPFLTKRLFQNFSHNTTAVLSWHVQKFVAILLPVTESQQWKVSLEFELQGIKIICEIGPRFSGKQSTPYCGRLEENWPGKIKDQWYCGVT